MGFGDDRHVLIVGGTRGGKGTTFLINNLCHWQGSAVVVDPKGENATVTAIRRGEGNNVCDGMGQAVHVLDPYRVANVPRKYRSCFNPLDWLDPDDRLCTKKAERLATSLVPIKTKSEEYWDNEARSLLGALLVHVATHPFYEGRRTLLTVRDLLMRGDTVSVDILKEGGEEDVVSPLDFLWQTMVDNEACDGYCRDTGTYFRDLTKDASEQWAGVRAGAKTATDFLTSKGMRELVSKSDFTIGDIKNDPKGCTMYLSIPQDFIASDSGWLRMMIDMVSTEAKIIPGQPKTGHQILLMLDEFAGLRRMDVLEKSIAQIAGYGVKMVCVVQELGQLEDVYQKNWETFISGSGVRIFFSNGDARTKDYVSKMAGDAEIVRELETNQETTGSSHATQTSEQKTEGTSTNRGSNWNFGGGRNGNNGQNYEPGGLFNWFPSKTGQTKGGGGGLNAGYGRGSGSGTSRSTATTTGETKTTTQSHARGQNESLHKRRLVEPHDVEQKFARIEQRNDPRYPGIALVMVAGYPPMPIRKCNYFEDPAFFRCFTPHPDHPYIPLLDNERKRPFAYLGEPHPPKQLIAFSKPSEEFLTKYDTSGLVQVSYTFKPGETIEAGRMVFAAFNVNDVEKDEKHLKMLAPMDGIVYDWRNIDDTEPGEPFLLIEPTKEGRDTLSRLPDTNAFFQHVMGSWLNVRPLPREKEGTDAGDVVRGVRKGLAAAFFPVLAPIAVAGLAMEKDWDGMKKLGGEAKDVYNFNTKRVYADAKTLWDWMVECLSYDRGHFTAPSYVAEGEREWIAKSRPIYRFDPASKKWKQVQPATATKVEG
ncbi:MAG: type IV secretory system conjugative DNA transfer family protein [Rhodopirellula bahusiensis]|uniref:type IV secretory system conjugative DNA transfer family protein n=1 Tax=Rhodopirellula bahusiensis TaxID=2014065 RepID=UPI0032972E89